MSPILDPNTIEMFSRSPDQTRRIGMRLGAMMEQGDVLFLEGDLGSGKTTLTKGIASGWGSIDTVTSPTFVLINTYQHPTDSEILYHLDAYRLNSAEEALDLDIDMMLATGPLVVEWADRIWDALPKEHLTVRLKWLDEEHRNLQIIGRGKRFEKMIVALRREAFGIR